MELQLSPKELKYMLGSTIHVIKDTDSMDRHTEHVDNIMDGVDGSPLVVRYLMNHKAVLLYIRMSLIVCHKLYQSDTQS